MRWTYSCPHCQAMLNPDETVVLIGECGPHRILIGFHPEPGNYRAYFPPEFELQEGRRGTSRARSAIAVWSPDAAPDLCALDLATQGVRHRLYLLAHRGGPGHLPDHRRGDHESRKGCRTALAGDAGARLNLGTLPALACEVPPVALFARKVLPHCDAMNSNNATSGTDVSEAPKRFSLEELCVVR